MTSFKDRETADTQRPNGKGNQAGVKTKILMLSPRL